jgi:hypothetical protein
MTAGESPREADPDSSETPDAAAVEDERAKRTYALVIGWGVLTLVLLWFFARAYEV